MTNEITLKIDESNELKFKIKIQGTTSESGSTKQSVRLLITDKNDPDAMGIVFPVSAKSDDNLLTFIVPPLSSIVKPDIAYEGKIEVIIGTRIFCPMTLNVFFIRDMTVEVTPLEVNASEKPLSKPKATSSDIEDFSNLLEDIEKVNAKKQITLTKSQLEQMIKERREKMILAAKPAQVPSVLKPAISNTFKNTFKDSFKELMKSALVDDKESKKSN